MHTGSQSRSNARARRALVVAGGLAAVLLGASCSSAPNRTSETQLLVSAAASLTDAFDEIGQGFEAAHPEVRLVLNLGGSSALREQILGGAPADVYASADLANMQQIVEAGLVVGEPRIFARNWLQIAVPAANPAGIHRLADFAAEEPLLGLCAEGVPCGELARQALTRAGVTPALDTNEPDVRALLTKIELGELDAGIVYATDVASTGGAVHGIEIPEPNNAIAEYRIAVLANAPHPQTAADFVAFVLSAQGQGILASYGFAAP